MNNKTIFLGGTCAKNDWRVELIDKLQKEGVDTTPLFNPVVSGWTEAFQAVEDEAKETCALMVYYIADPKQEGNPISAYSMIEASMALYDDPERTVVVFESDGMVDHAKKVQDKTEKDFRKRFPEANVLANFDELVQFVKKQLAD